MFEDENEKLILDI